MNSPLRQAPRRTPKRRAGPSLGRRLFSSVSPALLGMALGYTYAFQTLPEELLKAGRVPAMYACMGAVIGILVLRLGTLMFTMFRDFTGRQ